MCINKIPWWNLDLHKYLISLKYRDSRKAGNLVSTFHFYNWREINCIRLNFSRFSVYISNTTTLRLKLSFIFAGLFGLLRLIVEKFYHWTFWIGVNILHILCPLFMKVHIIPLFAKLSTSYMCFIIIGSHLTFVSPDGKLKCCQQWSTLASSSL